MLGFINSLKFLWKLQAIFYVSRCGNVGFPVRKCKFLHREPYGLCGGNVENFSVVYFFF